jgi:hypothetical protein
MGMMLVSKAFPVPAFTQMYCNYRLEQLVEVFIMGPCEHVSGSQISGYMVPKPTRPLTIEQEGAHIM